MLQALCGCCFAAGSREGLQPVAFESRKLQPPERKLAPYDRELLALVHALLEWKHLLLGAKFNVHTDQQALKYLLTAPVRTSRQERWLTEIMRFMPDIKYVKGTDNVVADALSRRVDLAVMHVSSVSVSSLLQEIALLCVSDPTVSKPVDEAEPYVSSSSPVTVTSPPPLYADKRGGVYEVEAITAKKKVGKSWQYLVKWKGYDETENTWEPLAHVRHLADDVAAAPVLS
eukprot:jgi/Botrbrau1/10182/Bobra.0121s0025.1